MIKVTDVAFVRFRAPDLDRMERFLGDFGLITSERNTSTLYSRGTDPEPYIHVTETGDPGFAGVAFDAATPEDLRAASDLDGASGIEPLEGPAGGQRVRFTDPDGFKIDVVYGREPLSPLAVRPTGPINRGSHPARFGALQRLSAGPAQVKRIGHVVLRVTDFMESSTWYKSRFGFIDSDRMYVGDRENIAAAFMRCDRGEDYVDHHTFLCIGAGAPAFDHAAFEVEDTDALMLGHDHLEQAGTYQHHAGIGRHVLGSQVFDYWKDPWGHVMEHFTDGDLINAQAETGHADPSVVLGTQWGSFLAEP